MKVIDPDDENRNTLERLLMEGENILTLSHETMTNIVQQWLRSTTVGEWCNRIVVRSVIPCSTTGTPPRAMFEVKISVPAQKERS